MTTSSISAAISVLSFAPSSGAADGTVASFLDVFAALAPEQTESEAAGPTASQVAAVAEAPKVCLDTTRGKFAVNLDEYFTPRTGVNFDDNSLPPLLFPSADNIDQLASHSSAKFRQLLFNYDIPAAPASITYGCDGQMQLPADYAYADELRDALKANPALERELSTLNALTSHYALMQESLPFVEAYTAAKSQSEINQIVAQYSYLFSNSRAYPAIELTFSATGDITPTINGQPLDAGQD